MTCRSRYLRSDEEEWVRLQEARAERQVKLPNPTVCDICGYNYGKTWLNSELAICPCPSHDKLFREGLEGRKSREGRLNIAAPKTRASKGVYLKPVQHTICEACGLPARALLLCHIQ